MHENFLKYTDFEKTSLLNYKFDYSVEAGTVMIFDVGGIHRW